MSGKTVNKLALLKAKKPREIAHPVVLDHEAVEAYAAARRELEAAKEALRNARRFSNDAETLVELQAAVDTAQAYADELESAADEGAGIVTVKVRAMPPLAYAALKAEHPPTDDDHKRIRAMLDDEKVKAAWNRDFPPRLVAACAVEPAVSVEEAQGFMESWNEAEWGSLVNACLRANSQSADVSSLVFRSGRTRS